MPEIKFRATGDEAEKVARDAEARGLSLPAYLRSLLGLAPPRRMGAPDGNLNNPHGRTGKPKVKPKRARRRP